MKVSDTARLDAEILLGHCIGKNRAYLYTWPEVVPEFSAVKHFDGLIAQAEQGVPIAYLTGECEFWSLAFSVTPDTLIPRPDTELIVQLSLDILANKPGPLLDLGTGSGAIAISIATEMQSLPIDAADNSKAALDIAIQNANRHDVVINFIQSDWFEQITRTDYQLIVSNPPYIAEDDPHLRRGGLQYEPVSALQAPDSGLAAIKEIIQNAHRHAATGAWLLIEHGYTQGAIVQQIFQQAGACCIRTEQDIEHRDRVTLGQLP